MITTNTDGDPISQAFAAAMAEPSVMYSMKLYRNGSDLGAVIKRAKLDLGAGQFSDDLGTFAACGVYQTQFSASLYDCPSILGEELEVRVGVLTGNAYEYVAVAYVTITEESVWKGVTDVRGVGRMGLMHAPHGLADGDYQPAAIAAAIYAATGIPVSIDARLTTQSVHADAGGTCRDALESTCARLGAFACELGEGVSVMPYSSTVTGTIPTGHVTGKPELGTLYEVDGITVESESGELVQGTGRVHIVDGTATATTAAATWGNMRGYAFTPATLNIALIDPRWTVADMLEVTLGEDDYSIPARGISITYDGGYFGTISAAGLTAEAEEMTVEGPLTRSVGYARSVADEALEVAQATGQYFWHDDNGAHVSTEALNPTGPSNSLWNSLGLLIRKATNYLVSITSSAIAFYDGLGNVASNIVASFGSAGFQVGYAGESHLEGDYHSLQLLDKEGDAYFYVSDLRDSGGTASVEDSFIGNGSTTSFVLSNTASDTAYTVKLDGSVVTSGITKTTTKVTFSTPPSSGHEVLVSYTTTSQSAKAYTFGVRGSGNVGAMSVASGASCDASGYSSTAEGGQTAASGKYSHAENEKTTASGRSAHAEGYNSTASGSYSHAENDSTASGLYAHSEGYRTTASGRYSHSEGIDAIASGESSHAEGAATTASGIHSHAQGFGTIAAAQNQTAIGKFNIKDNLQEFAEIVGNGTDDNNRSNARTLDWNGNETLAGGLTLGSPLTIANGGTGATTAEGARSNLLAVGYQSGINAQVSNFIGATQLFGLNATCINANNTLNGKRASLIVRNEGLSGWNISDSSQMWSVTFPTSSINFNNAFTSTVAQVISAASGFTVSQASYVQNGRMGQWYMTVKTTNAMSANTQYTIGTIVSGKRPAVWSPVTFGDTTNAYGNGRMVAGGSVIVRPSASIAAGSTFYLLCPAYILG